MSAHIDSSYHELDMIPQCRSSYVAKPSKKGILNAQDREDDTQIGRPPRPFVKWVGGKRQLLDVLHENAPDVFGRYHEPFVGGGAFFFSKLPDSAIISDANAELINCYRVIRDDADALIRSLRRHRNEEEYFYSLRAKDLARMTPVQRASRFIYLNKTCFNGLYRENNSGYFNVPFGRYDNPKIVDTENLLAVSNYLHDNNIDISCQSYECILDSARSGDFVYFDPPYAPISTTANFAGYLKGGFGVADQVSLADVFTSLTKAGVMIMLSNSNTELIRDLYKGFNLKTIYANRSINCNGNRRGKEANEVLVTNY